jgi:hypothetical protein
VSGTFLREKSMSAKSNKTESQNAAIREIITTVQDQKNRFIKTEHVTGTLTGKDIMRLRCVGPQTYGFVEKALEIGRENPAFLDHFIDINEFAVLMGRFRDMRELSAQVKEFSHAVDECLRLTGDQCYKTSSRIYHSLKSVARYADDSAKPLCEGVWSKTRLVSEQA